MKAYLIVMMLLLLNKGCSQSQINQDAVSLEYSAMSRGKFLEINITKKSVAVKKDRNASVVSASCKKEDWDELISELKSIDIENIPNLKAPSENRFFDGAAIANLTVHYNGNSYKTNSFDHGNPPEPIAKLVKVMLSISENIE
ncbi:hypothetical protein [Siansivirga zeaxanthinifaciens]|uniref:Lipoprotein n=1 Tax=Siansivirga zeaxanthinifaciens CC-SAMT-1 TaxID=1454006 RepID=A0A0C5WCI7_9FLAO|nr:hypothetical protein [Siansivirga zeaxanthinifaciens]AJR04733.1 hypothetical protein AW14_02620 [Siansivirga zeaxanthinifaciens CC-SAMT-1]